MCNNILQTFGSFKNIPLSIYIHLYTNIQNVIILWELGTIIETAYKYIW